MIKMSHLFGLVAGINYEFYNPVLFVLASTTPHLLSFGFSIAFPSTVLRRGVGKQQNKTLFA